MFDEVIFGIILNQAIEGFITRKETLRSNVKSLTLKIRLTLLIFLINMIVYKEKIAVITFVYGTKLTIPKKLLKVLYFLK